MKIVESDSVLAKCVNWIVLILVLYGTVYGATFAGQQDSNGVTLLVASYGAGAGLLLSVTIVGVGIYPILVFVIHLMWCLFTHDDKYHWFVRTITGMRLHGGSIHF